jgi:hypothetical protein
MMGKLDQSSISPEQEVVIASIKVNPQQDDRFVQLLAGELNWSTLRQLVLQHRILPLFYSRLKTLEVNSVPPEELAWLKESFLINAQRNLHLTRMLARIFDLFSEHEVQFIPLKGPVLAVQLYRDTSMRQFTDLDLMIREEDFRRCDQILSAAGFTPKFPVNTKNESWLLRGDVEHEYFYKGDLLDLHWAIAERGVYHPLDTAEFWCDLGLIELHGRQFFSLSPENLLYTLCIHGGKHMWSSLTWVSDLAHFAKTFPDFNWSNALDRATKNGFFRVICVGLRLADTLGGAKLPQQIRSRYLSDPAITQLASEALQTIFNLSVHSDTTMFNYYSRSRERFRERLYQSIDQIFIPKQEDWQTIPLPKFLYPAYYLLRPVRLLIKFGPQLITSSQQK